MTTVYEISSDSEDTVVPPQYNCLEEQKLNDSDLEVELLVNKYFAENCLKDTKSNHSGCLEEPLIKKTKKLDPYCDNPVTTKDDYEELRILQEKYGTYKSTQRPDEKITKVDRKQKKEGKEQKKRELEQEKHLKRAAAAADKNEKPTECMKFITVRIDPDIIKEEYGDDITKGFQEVDVAYKIEAQICPGTVTWIRKVESYKSDDNGKLVLTSEQQETDHVLLIITGKTFINHVDQNTLCGHVSSVKSLFRDKKVTLVVYGFKKLIQSKKTGIPNVHKTRVNYSLTELQIMCSCSVRFFDSSLELALFVSQFTKAIAEIPFKLRRHEEFQRTDFYLSGVNRDCVQVDKTGNGLNRLWKQMLTMFPLARLETAEAISSLYPTVSSLMEAYERCSSQKEAELLLQDIPIRRAAGPLSSSRKIGPELSKKIYTYLTSVDGDVLL